MKTIRTTVAKPQVQAAITAEIAFRAKGKKPVEFLTLSDGDTQHEKDVFAAVPNIAGITTLNMDAAIVASMKPVDNRHMIETAKLGTLEDHGWENDNGNYLVAWHDYCGFISNGFFAAAKRMNPKTTTVFVTFCALPKNQKTSKKLQSILGPYDDSPEEWKGQRACKLAEKTIEITKKRMAKLGFKMFYDVQYIVKAGRMVTIGFCGKTSRSLPENEVKEIDNSGTPKTSYKKKGLEVVKSDYACRVEAAAILRNSGMKLSDIARAFGITTKKVGGLYRSGTVRKNK